MVDDDDLGRAFAFVRAQEEKAYPTLAIVFFGNVCDKTTKLPRRRPQLRRHTTCRQSRPKRPTRPSFYTRMYYFGNGRSAAKSAAALTAATAAATAAEAAWGALNTAAAEAAAEAEAEEAHLTCVVCLTPFARAHGVSCGASAPHFLCGDVGGAGCLGGLVRARAQALRETDTLARRQPELLRSLYLFSSFLPFVGLGDSCSAGLGGGGGGVFLLTRGVWRRVDQVVVWELLFKIDGLVCLFSTKPIISPNT